MTKSKFGLPSVNIKLHDAMRTRGLIDLQVFTAKFKMLKTQILQGVTGRFKQLHAAVK